MKFHVIERAVLFASAVTTILLGAHALGLF